MCVKKKIWYFRRVEIIDLSILNILFDSKRTRREGWREQKIVCDREICCKSGKVNCF